MILVPQRLFNDPRVKTLTREGNNCILQKHLTASLQEREAYVANHVVSLVISGRQTITTYEEKTVSAGPGDVLFLPRGVYYITDLISGREGFESLLFYFDDEAIHRFLTDTSVTEVNRDNAPEFLKFGNSTTLDHFRDGILKMGESVAITNALLRLKTTELLHLLHGLSDRQTFAEFLFCLTLPKRRNLRQFMERNYQKPLGVEDYAYLTGRSVSSFRRDFVGFFGTTPNKWLRTRRMQEAVALLEAREFSVTELSYAVGYENTSYFIREFRKVTGQSPKQYMLSRKGDQRPPADA